MTRTTKIVLAIVLGCWVEIPAAADTVVYRFDGTLANDRGSVTGQFAYQLEPITTPDGATYLDAKVLWWNFETPLGSYTNELGESFIGSGTSPSGPLTTLTFSNNGDFNMSLWFRGSYDGFAGGALYTDYLGDPSADNRAQIYCNHGKDLCAAPNAPWESGLATDLTATSVPEPSSLFLLGTSFIGLGTVIRRKLQI